MKKIILIGTASILALSSCVSKKKHEEVVTKLVKAKEELALAKVKKENKMNLEKEIDKVSYSLGLNVAQNIKSQGLDEISYDAFAKGVEDVYEANGLQIEAGQAQQILQEYFGKAAAAKSNKLKAEGEKFLAENKKRPEVITTASGLQYEILKEGNGPKPSATSTVKTHYHGTLLDGTVFDSSVERGQPTSFPVNRVIAAWTEALQLMPVGSKWKLYCPYNLAYGEQGAGGKIGPFATLIFEVELLEIEK